MGEGCKYCPIELTSKIYSGSGAFTSTSGGAKGDVFMPLKLSFISDIINGFVIPTPCNCESRLEVTIITNKLHRFYSNKH